MMIFDLRSPDRPRVTLRLSRDGKSRFQALAASRGLSESALLRQLVASVLGPGTSDAAQATHSELGNSDSIRVWLRPGDGKLLRSRALQREMSCSAYVAALIRGHLRKDPPMPLNELARLERCLAEVSAVGRRLAQSAAQIEETHGVEPAMLNELAVVRQHMEELRQALREAVKVNRISWESPDVRLAPVACDAKTG